MYQVDIPIPYCYLKLTEESTNRGELFKQYVRGYIIRNYLDFELVKIDGMKAICRKRGVEDDSSRDS